MKCPKCGFENPEGTLFCEECDWRTDVPYKPEKKKKDPKVFAAVSLIVGIVSIVPVLVNVVPLASIAIGAIGLVLGGYSINLPKYIECPNKSLLIGLTAVGLILSIVGFIFGLYTLAL